MVKSPMEYFQEQDFSMNTASGQDISPAERAFLKKYLGLDDPSAAPVPPVEGKPVAGLTMPAARPAATGSGQVSPAPAPAAASAPAPAAAPEKAVEPVPTAGQPPAPAAARAGLKLVPDEPAHTSLDTILQTQELVTLVGFYAAGDIFVVPIDAVHEVIRYEEPYKLPKAPFYMPGVVNLRGRILPVVRLADLLILEGRRKAAAATDPSNGKNGLIIICEARGMQIGLLIDKLHTMFKAGQSDLNWNAEAHLGPSAELLCGLLETGEKLLGIVSVERVVDKLLEA